MKFDKLYKLIMQDINFNFSKEEKDKVIQVLKNFNLWDDFAKKYINQICYEMYEGHKYGNYQLKNIDKQGVEAILKDVKINQEDDHKEELAEAEESVKADKSRRIIKEEMEPGYWEKVDQYKADIQAYLDKGDGEEYDGFEGDVDEDDFYTTVKEICLQNPDKVKALDQYLTDFVNSIPGGDTGDSMFGSLGLYQDVVEGNEGYSEGNVFYGLKDPETFTNLGFNVGEELAVLLKQHFVDVAQSPDASFWEGYGNDFADGSAQEALTDMGLVDTVDAIETIRQRDQDQDDDQDDEE